ncbi:MAG: hypothetical protein D6808_05525 [Candidatus Dadabacteria bacterium]|nr:MAG: hypothetical protein D6808_05525 [Candidatus Dadabacteria bacterium]
MNKGLEIHVSCLAAKLKVAVIFAVVFASCAHYRQVRISHVIAGVKASSDKIRTIKALAQVKLSVKGKVYRYRYSIVAVREGSYRVEIFPQNAAKGVFAAVSDGRSSLFLDFVKHRKASYSDSNRALREIFGVNIKGGDLVWILSGLLPGRLIKDPNKVVTCPAEYSLCYFKNALGYKKISFYPRTLRLQALEFFSNVAGALPARLEYSGTKNREGFLFPDVIVIRGRGIEAEIKLSVVRINEKVDRGLFDPSYLM